MADRKMVVDTGVFLEYLGAADKSQTLLQSVTNESVLAISAITLYELYMAATTRDKLRDVQVLTKELLVLPVTDDVALNAAKIFQYLKRQENPIELRDILVAATAVVNDLPIMTLHRSHYERVEGLKIAKV